MIWNSWLPNHIPIPFIWIFLPLSPSLFHLILRLYSTLRKDRRVSLASHTLQLAALNLFPSYVFCNYSTLICHLQWLFLLGNHFCRRCRCRCHHHHHISEEFPHHHPFLISCFLPFFLAAQVEEKLKQGNTKRLARLESTPPQLRICITSYKYVT